MPGTIDAQTPIVGGIKYYGVGFRAGLALTAPAVATGAATTLSRLDRHRRQAELA